MRRYIIHADRRATWILVASTGVCRWRVEMLRPGRDREFLTLEAFEASGAGRELSAKLQVAINEAQEDA